ncbi:hypothetical protein HIM_07948 [Hirsutella minnesotensis 3608]|uniref:Sec20 domain-containing protein n=1 Tax=Hirsutella minnesotensis 3608 TaxID=1043627 RepID=A0A0F8A3X5_9HYPO|nr:hypothetical protein HIM_07948 [Hirsutella minnesotensis 3608]
MSLHVLQQRLTALQETTAQLRELIDRLANLKFQPGSVPLDTEEENSPSGELSAEIGLVLRTGLEEQELLQEEVKYARPEGHDKARLQEGVERLGTQLSSQRSAFRKARLAAKKSLEKAQKLERELLIQSFSRPVSECATPSSGNGETPAPVLRRPRGQTHQQQQQQATAADARPHCGGAVAKRLNESYTSLDSMLASSRDLLGTLLRSQKSDTWYLQTALYMLAVTGAWLLFRRILYGPMWWLVWLPLRLLFGVGSKAGSAVLRSRGNAPGERAASAHVGDEGGRIRVDGLPNDDLPIVKVGHESDAGSDNIHLDAVIEKAREIADAAKEKGAQTEGKDSVSDDAKQSADDVAEGTAEKEANPKEEAKNTKKRMWEETEGVQDTGYARDEL